MDRKLLTRDTVLLSAFMRALLAPERSDARRRKCRRVHDRMETILEAVTPVARHATMTPQAVTHMEAADDALSLIAARCAKCQLCPPEEMPPTRIMR